MSQHNPIARIISQYQKAWTKEISPNPAIKIIRWIFKEEEAKLIDGFLKLESTENGSTNDVQICLFTAFDNDLLYAKKLTADFIEIYKEANGISGSGLETKWHYQPMVMGRVPSDYDYQENLLHLLTSFRDCFLQPQQKLVIVLMPERSVSAQGMHWWLQQLLKKDIPPQITFLVQDHLEKNIWDELAQKNQDKVYSFFVPVNLGDAINQIAKGGNPNAGDTILRRALLDMGAASQARDLKELKRIGEQTISVLSSKNHLPTVSAACLLYAGNLFGFKEYGLIDNLVLKSTQYLNQDKKTPDAEKNAIRLQTLSLQAASLHHQKKYKEALNVYKQQGDLAHEMGNPIMAMQPWMFSYMMAAKYAPSEMTPTLEKAYQEGIQLPAEDLKNTQFGIIALDYLQSQAQNNPHATPQLQTQLESKLGGDWMDKARAEKKIYLTFP